MQPPPHGFGPPPPYPPPQGPPQGFAPPNAPPAPAAPAGGVMITLPARIAFPPVCANCAAPADASVNASSMIRRGNRRITRTYGVPHCRACAGRLSGHKSKRTLFGLLQFGLVLVISALAFAVPGLPMPVLVAVPVILATALGVVFYVILRPPPAQAPATSSVEAIKLVTFDDARSTFYCTNPQYAHMVAQHNAGQAVPVAPRTMYSAVAFPVVALVLAGLASGGAVAITHPTVCLDNETKESVQFWMDGSPLEVVSPGKYSLAHLPYGEHELGWSKPGAAKPDATTTGDVSIGDAHLVNAYEAGCYWIDGAVYGSASMSKDFHPGPQPLLPFYAFDKVDIWFGDLPQSITTKSSGETRVAVQTYRQCMKMRATCPDELVKPALACDANAKDDDQAASCWSSCIRRRR